MEAEVSLSGSKMTKSSTGNILRIQAQKSGISTDTRITTIPIGLNKCVLHPEDAIMLRKLANQLGLQRYIVGLFSNYHLIQLIDQNLTIPEINKTFYDRCWSTMNQHLNQQTAKTGYESLYQNFSSFIKDSGIDLSLLGKPVLCRLWEPITRDMYVASSRFLKESYYSRSYQYHKYLLQQDQSLMKALKKKFKKLGIAEESQNSQKEFTKFLKKELNSLADALTKAVTCPKNSCYLSYFLERFYELNLGKSLFHFRELIREEQKLLEEIIKNIPISKKQEKSNKSNKMITLPKKIPSKRTVSIRRNYLDKIKKVDSQNKNHHSIQHRLHNIDKWVKKYPHKFIKFYSFLSIKSESGRQDFRKQILDIVNNYIESVGSLDNSLTKDQRREEIKKLQATKKEKVKAVARANLVPGKSFNLLPIWKLQPAFVELSNTTMKLLFKGRIQGVDDIFSQIFDLSMIHQLKWFQNRWRVTSLTTEGFSLRVRLQGLTALNPESPNISSLAKSGYQISSPESEILWNQPRGVYKMTRTRIDSRIVSPENSKKIIIHAVDPGHVNPVSVNEIRLDHCETIQQVQEHGNFWELTGKEFRKDSGRLQSNYRESQRRKKNPKYGQAIRRLGQCLSKTANLKTFQYYLKAIGSELEVLNKEKMRTRRKKDKWGFFVQRQSSLQRLTDRLSGRDSVSRTIPNFLELSPEEKKELTAKLRSKIKDQKVRRQSQHIVLFGNGSFRSGGAGHSSIPKKKLVYMLGNKCLTYVFDEYRTSKCCPGCGAELEDGEKENRVRYCPNSSDTGEYGCQLTSKIAKRGIDRDQSATMNISRCAYQVLMKGKWLSWLLKA